ncbi:hypothetical protein M0804_001795 [Polistes exclamans]|nr:hypothetical protein M0804_001795 [Polistes exclamans]
MLWSIAAKSHIVKLETQPIHNHMHNHAFVQWYIRNEKIRKDLRIPMIQEEMTIRQRTDTKEELIRT